jgi:hypothetical protein
MTRARSGMYEFREKFPDLTANNNTDSARSLRVIATNPSMWLDAPIYLGIMSLAKLRAHQRLCQGRSRAWERDDSSRQ